MATSTDKRTKAQGASSKKSGPHDKEYVNKREKYETDYEPKRKTPAKEFGKH